VDRCAVLVDAGYLLGAAGTMLGGDKSRTSLVVNHEALVAGIVTEAERQTGLPVLRVLWYDASFDTRPTAEHKILGLLPDVKVRLGVLVRRGDKFEQKGVDSYLQRDLTAMGRHHAVADVVLLGGDEDLRRGLEEAQDHGLKVHLWGVEAAAPQYNQSPSLIAEADRRWVLTAEWISRYVSVREEADLAPRMAAAPGPPHSPDSMSAVPLGAVPMGAPSMSATPLGAVPIGAPSMSAVSMSSASMGPVSEMDRHGVGGSPADLARFAGHRRDDGQPRNVAYVPTVTREPILPRLLQLSTYRQKAQDSEEDATSVLATPELVGQRYGQRWAARATAEQRDSLLGFRPGLPRPIDGELLHYAFNQGIDTWENMAAKLAVRTAALKAVEEVADSQADRTLTRGPDALPGAMGGFEHGPDDLPALGSGQNPERA
jgi:hypothetical protein